MVNLANGRRLDDGNDADSPTPGLADGSRLVWARDDNERELKDVTHLRSLRMEARARRDDNTPSVALLAELDTVKKKLLDAAKLIID